MTSTGGAYGTKASDTDFRKKWDKEEYAEKAKQKDQEERERMQENEERMKQGTVHRVSSEHKQPHEMSANCQARNRVEVAKTTFRSPRNS